MLSSLCQSSSSALFHLHLADTVVGLSSSFWFWSNLLRSPPSLLSRSLPQWDTAQNLEVKCTSSPLLPPPSSSPVGLLLAGGADVPLLFILLLPFLFHFTGQCFFRKCCCAVMLHCFYFSQSQTQSAVQSWDRHRVILIQTLQILLSLMLLTGEKSLSTPFCFVDFNF